MRCIEDKCQDFSFSFVGGDFFHKGRWGGEELNFYLGAGLPTAQIKSQYSDRPPTGSLDLCISDELVLHSKCVKLNLYSSVKFGKCMYDQMTFKEKRFSILL